MRSHLRAGLAVVLLVVGAAPADAPAAARQADDAVAAAQAVLDTRATAIRTRDRGEFLATVDPEAPATFRDEQARSFDGWASVPLETYRLTLRDEFGDLAPPDLTDRYGGDPVFLPETRQAYRLAGYDDADAVDTLWLTFVQRGGRWYVGGDEDIEAVGLETARMLWELGPVRVHPTDRLLVLSRPEHIERADALAGIAGEAVGILASRWPPPWDGRVPLVLPGSVDELEVMLQSTFDLDDFVAFVAYNVVTDDGWTATAPRIYVQDRNLSRYGRDFQVETLVHELVHAASAPVAGPFVDDWVHEGLADWIATGMPGPELPAGTDGQLPDPWEFRAGGGTAILRSYRESRSAMAFLADGWGRDAPVTLLRELGSLDVALGSVDYRVGEAIRTITGMGLEEFRQAWAAG